MGTDLFMFKNLDFQNVSLMREQHIKFLFLSLIVLCTTRSKIFACCSKLKHGDEKPENSRVSSVSFTTSARAARKFLGGSAVQSMK